MDEAAIPEEFWVFGFDIDDDCALTDLCIAKVLGQTDRKVPMFVLGPEIPLGHAVVPPPNGTFMPDDEDLDEALDGLDDDGDEMAPGA
ncbi:hypothetical protein C8D81_1801 [Enemella evansiae]|nr:hypothetical protein C8D81_1801 [Enemella evansiae]